MGNLRFVVARAITTRSGLSYTPVPPIPPPLFDENESLTEKETEVTKDKVLPSTKDIQPPVIQKSHDPVKPVSSPISPEPSSAQVNNSPPAKEPSKETHLPYPQRMKAQKNKKEKNDMQASFVSERMFQKLHFKHKIARVLIDVYGEELVKENGMEGIVFKPSMDSSSPTSTIVEEFDSLVGEIIKQKEEVKKISDPVARRRACFTSNLKNFRIIHQGRVIHSPQIASVDKERISFPIPRESKIGKECDFPLCDDFQSFKTFSNPLFEKKDDFPSRNDESILKEEVHKETLKSYLNPLFEDDEEIISIEVSRQISPKVNSEPSIESLPKDDFDNDDDLFEMDSNNDEWKI
ncbi:hypothetical protein Tco_1143406 [Tanacetum coccineum]